MSRLLSEKAASLRLLQSIKVMDRETGPRIAREPEANVAIVAINRTRSHELPRTGWRRTAVRPVEVLDIVHHEPHPHMASRTFTPKQKMPCRTRSRTKSRTRSRTRSRARPHKLKSGFARKPAVGAQTGQHAESCHEPWTECERMGRCKRRTTTISGLALTRRSF